jgi:hypothetical protein
MESSGIGALGIYLTLAFVLPGFCYVGVFALCFRNAANTGVYWCSRKNISTTLSIVGIGVVGGLLLSLICFCIELLLHGWKFFDHHFPVLDIPRMAIVEAAGKGTSILQILSGSAFMHFNIAAGILILLGAYGDSAQANAARKPAGPTANTSQLGTGTPAPYAPAATGTAVTGVICVLNFAKDPRQKDASAGHPKTVLQWDQVSQAGMCEGALAGLGQDVFLWLAPLQDGKAINSDNSASDLQDLKPFH